jgi:outer membrane protein OmpA-like peptidoglycan-associated protein
VGIERRFFENHFSGRKLIMRKSLLLMGVLLLAFGTIAAQDDFPKVEASPEFEFIHTSPPFGNIGNQSFNCLGGGGTIAYNFTKMIGIASNLDYCKFTNLGTALVQNGQISANAFTFLFGPRLTFRGESRFQPFADVYFGGDRLSANCQAGTNCASVIGTTGSFTRTAFAMTAGGGFNIKLNRRFALRPVQAEYLYTRFGSNTQFSGNQSQNSFRLLSGFVIGFGLPTLVPPSASCSVQPTDVYAGEPITATAHGANFNPKRTLNYSWTSSGGKISGKGESASLDTSGMSPGSYTASANITDGKKGQASCQSSFTIKERPKNPPQISCSANPTTVQAGTPSSISCNCSSPDNAPDYPVQTSISNWSASGGRVSGTGNAATLDTTGASAGPVTITATCSDNRGLTSNGTASVNVEVPPPPPQASKLNEITFKRNSARVDNTAKAILDDVALRLQREADSRAVIVGNADPKERKSSTLAAQRAANAKEYLTKEKGIDPGRIETRTGQGGTMNAEVWLVPAGASFDQPDTTVVTTPATKAPYGRRAAPAKKKSKSQ